MIRKLIYCILTALFIANAVGCGNGTSRVVQQTPKVMKAIGKEVSADIAFDMIKNSLSEVTAKSTDKDVIVQKELSLSDVSIGEKMFNIEKKLGKPSGLTITNNGKELIYRYSDLEIVIYNNMAVGLVSYGSSAVTPRGIREGDSLQKVIKKYGEDYLLSEYEDLYLYEYRFSITDKVDGILRFAVKKGTDTVDYISARVIMD